MSSSFNVCGKSPSFKTIETPLITVPHKDAFTEQLNAFVESASTGNTVTSKYHGLLQVVFRSFADHRHLILDPDTIWITIMHGFAKHINLNAEALRKKFVDFEGKTKLTISRDDFIKGVENPWDNCFPEFSDKISEYIGDKRDLIVCDFTTTTTPIKAVSELVLMDAMQCYFAYGCTTACGIPSVTLEGNLSDWEDINVRLKKMLAFDFDATINKWVSNLIEVMDQFILAYKGIPNNEFWVSFLKEHGGSGGPFIDGHILNFFLYDKHDRLVDIKRDYTTSSFATTLSSVPFEWMYYGKKFAMEFAGGIVGIETDTNTGGVRTSFGWAVRELAHNLSTYPLEDMYKDMLIYDKHNKALKLKRLDVDDRIDRETRELISREVDEMILEYEDGTQVKLRRYDLINYSVKG